MAKTPKYWTVMLSSEVPNLHYSKEDALAELEGLKQYNRSYVVLELVGGFKSRQVHEDMEVVEDATVEEQMQANQQDHEDEDPEDVERADNGQPAQPPGEFRIRQAVDAIMPPDGDRARFGVPAAPRR